MSKGGGATWRLTRHAPFALVLAVAVALAAGTAAGADPAAPNAALAAKAKALQARLDAQNAEVERLAERLNATDDRRHRLQVSLADYQEKRNYENVTVILPHTRTVTAQVTVRSG